jgi:hypothetical protein
MKIHIVLCWIDITFPSAGETASSSSPVGVRLGSRKKMIKKIVKMAPMINKRYKIEDIRPDPDIYFDLEASHVKEVKNTIPNIHDKEPLASILENPPYKIKEPIDHINYLWKYLKNSISYEE